MATFFIKCNVASRVWSAGTAQKLWNMGVTRRVKRVRTSAAARA